MLDRQFACLGLIPKGFQLLDGGADEHDAVLRAGAREIRVFTEQTVPGVNGINPVSLGGLNDGVNIKVSTHGRLVSADEEGLVGFVPVLGEAVFFL